jgi:hypothetical protein
VILILEQQPAKKVAFLPGTMRYSSHFLLAAKELPNPSNLRHRTSLMLLLQMVKTLHLCSQTPTGAHDEKKSQVEVQIQCRSTSPTLVVHEHYKPCVRPRLSEWCQLLQWNVSGMMTATPKAPMSRE